MPVELPRIPLAILPTPVHRLERLSAALGADLWIKRDDLTGFALGGNKGRKLEYLLADAVQNGTDAVVTCGSRQSNFVRQIGVACRMLGLACGAAVMDLPHEPEFGRPSGRLPRSGGNEIIDRLAGVDLRIHPDGSWDELFAHAEQLAEEYEAAGRRVFRVPVGGSSPLGAYAFYRAGLEANEQGAFDCVVCPSSSGSTHSGLAYAYAGSSTRVIGISCDPEPENHDDLVRLCAGLDDLLEEGKSLDKADFDLRFDYVGSGYGVVSDAAEVASRLLLDHEGIFLDPVYTAKAFAGLIDLLPGLSGRILFWHTGGLPTLFAESVPTESG